MEKKPALTEGNIVLYRTPEGATRIEVLYESETFWLNQKKMAELSQWTTIRKFRVVQTEGAREVACVNTACRRRLHYHSSGMTLVMPLLVWRQRLKSCTFHQHEAGFHPQKAGIRLQHNESYVHLLQRD